MLENHPKKSHLGLAKMRLFRSTFQIEFSGFLLLLLFLLPTYLSCDLVSCQVYNEVWNWDYYSSLLRAYILISKTCFRASSRFLWKEKRVLWLFCYKVFRTVCSFFLSHCERNKVLNEVRFLRIMKLAVKPRILRNTSSSSFAAKKCYQKWLFVVYIFCEVRVHLSLVPLFVRACWDI